MPNLHSVFLETTLREMRGQWKQIDAKGMRAEAPRCLLIGVRAAVERAGKKMDELPAASWRDIDRIVRNLRGVLQMYIDLGPELENL